MLSQALENLFVHELHDLHSAEHQLVGALMQVADSAESDRLLETFEGQVQQVRHRLTRLEHILHELGKSAPDATYDRFEGSVDVLIYGEWVPVE